MPPSLIPCRACSPAAWRWQPPASCLPVVARAAEVANQAAALAGRRSSLHLESQPVQAALAGSRCNDPAGCAERGPAAGPAATSQASAAGASSSSSSSRGLGDNESDRLAEEQLGDPAPHGHRDAQAVLPAVTPLPMTGWWAGPAPQPGAEPEAGAIGLSASSMRFSSDTCWGRACERSMPGTLPACMRYCNASLQATCCWTPAAGHPLTGLNMAHPQAAHSFQSRLHCTPGGDAWQIRKGPVACFMMNPHMAHSFKPGCTSTPGECKGSAQWKVYHQSACLNTRTACRQVSPVNMMHLPPPLQTASGCWPRPPACWQAWWPPGSAAAARWTVRERRKRTAERLQPSVGVAM